MVLYREVLPTETPRDALLLQDGLDVVNGQSTFAGHYKLLLSALSNRKPVARRPFDWLTNLPRIMLFPAGCDLEMVRDDLANMVKMWENDASCADEKIVFIQALATAINAFLTEPTGQHADELLQQAPMLEELFRTCSPGGFSYESDRLPREHR